MPNIITRKRFLSEKNSSFDDNLPIIEVETQQNTWLDELATAVSDPLILLEKLDIDPSPWQAGFAARQLFNQRVPLAFIAKMEKGNVSDPLLRQVLPVEQEFAQVAGYSTNPLHEIPEQEGLLHKYKNRVLLIVKGACAINCRYCFRRHFPYAEHQGNKRIWQQHLDYIKAHPEVKEVILSGGDPLMAKDDQLAWLIDGISQISHVTTLRIHTRLPVVIPNRVTDALCQLLKNSRLQVVLVTHINHANEIDDALSNALAKLKQANVHLLNQSVLLKGVNDSVLALTNLSNALFKAGVLPYYLHLLDKVQGAAHFYVSDDDARHLMQGLLAEVSGYLVPTLVREIGGEMSKTPISLYS